MKKFLLPVFSLLFSLPAFSQGEFSSFSATGRGAATTFVTDYHAIGINASNLGWSPTYEGKNMTMGISELSIGVHSEALSSQELRDDFLKVGDDDQSFSMQDKMNAARNFSESGTIMNIDVGLFGFSYQTENIGGFAFAVNERFQFDMVLGNEAADLLFLGYNYSDYFDSTAVNNNGDTTGYASNPRNISDLMDGSRITTSWTREYALSYGVKLLDVEESFQFFVGAGAKYVQGFAMVDLDARGDEFSAFSAVTPFADIDYGAAAAFNPSAVQQSGSLPTPVGHGFGFDVGLSMLIKEKIRIGAAVNNIGSITWDGNVYKIADEDLTQTNSEGLNGYNISQQAEMFMSDSGLFQLEGQESRTVSLPTTFRAGGSIILSEKFEAGFDFIMPLNDAPGSFVNPLMGVGLDFIPVKWIRISSGFMQGGLWGTNIPLGVTFIAGDGKWEAGLASRDAIGFFKDNGPTLSAAFGFARFRF